MNEPYELTGQIVTGQIQEPQTLWQFKLGQSPCNREELQLGKDKTAWQHTRADWHTVFLLVCGSIQAMVQMLSCSTAFTFCTSDNFGQTRQPATL